MPPRPRLYYSKWNPNSAVMKTPYRTEACCDGKGRSKAETPNFGPAIPFRRLGRAKIGIGALQKVRFWFAVDSGFVGE